MDTQLLFDRVNFIGEEKKYYFIRTNGGKNYSAYLDNNFIAIGWNTITIEDLLNNVDLLKNKIGVEVNKSRVANNDPILDLQSKKGKSKVTSVFNKLKKFKDLNRGDIIVIPSYNSDKLSFGMIDDDNIYIDDIPYGNCVFNKRRRVKWIEEKTMLELDPMFYKIKSNRHAISDISKYSEYIDFATNTLYLKGDSGFYVLNVSTNEEINVSSLLQLMQEVQDITNDLNNHFNLNENIQQNTIKLTLHSPGTVSFKFPRRVAVLFGLTVSLVTCQPGDVNVPNNEKNEAIGFINNPQHNTKLDSLIRTLDTLGANQGQRNTFR